MLCQAQDLEVHLWLLPDSSFALKHEGKVGAWEPRSHRGYTAEEPL